MKIAKLLGILGLPGRVKPDSLPDTETDPWSVLNTTLNGRLRRAEPLARPCFSTYNGRSIPIDDEACAAIRANYTANLLRDSIPGAFINAQSESCLSFPTDQCLLDNTVLPAPLPGPGTVCNQGSVPDVYLEVANASDIITAFSFARTHGIPLSIKNSGHDYLTRNSQKGSLLLWVHGLKGFTHYTDFTPEGCTSSIGRAMRVATGESTASAFAYASAHNSTLVGGYAPTVALSGGWVQGGGHGVLAPVYGIGADRVVQFRIVTPDGVLRTANRCQNADLFRALRGGGGGTFGVVLEATHRVEPVMPVAVASISLPGNVTVDQVKSWLALLARNALRWGEEGWGGHAAGLYIKYMNPLPSMANLSVATAASESMRAATEFALAVGGSSVVEVLPDYFDVWNKYVAPGATSGGPQRIVNDRLVPRDLFRTEEGIGKIVAFISKLDDLGFDLKNIYIPVGTPFVANDTAGRRPGDDPADPGTSVNPAWYSALWELGYGTLIPWNSTYEQRLQNFTVLGEVSRLEQELMGNASAAYMNEANVYLEDWREAWWGRGNYDFLVATKNKYDPDGLLKCWKCIGFEDADIDSERFRCQGKLQADIRALGQKRGGGIEL